MWVPLRPVPPTKTRLLESLAFCEVPDALGGSLVVLAQEGCAVVVLALDLR